MQVEILENAGAFGPIALIILMTVIALIAGSKTYFRPPYDADILTPMLLSVAMNAAVLVYRILSEQYLALDENVWHQQSALVGEAIRNNLQLDEGALTSGKEGYAWLVGFLYAMAGPAPLVPIVLNILLYSLLVPILAVITAIAADEIGLNRAMGKRSVTFATYFIALNPVIAFWSPRMLREIISMFLIASAVLCLIIFLRRKKAIYLIGVIAFVAALTTIRQEIGVGLGASLLMAIVVVQALSLRSRVAQVAFVAPIFAILFLGTWRFVDLSVEEAAYNNSALSNATSAFSGSEAIQSADSIVDIILFNLPRVLFGPFIHELNFSSVMLLAAVSNMFWLGAIFLAAQVLLRGRYAPTIASDPAKTGTRQNRIIVVLVVVLVTFSIMLSITAGNYGLVIRMRLMPFVVLIPLAGLGYTLIMERRELKSDRSRVKKSRSASRSKRPISSP